MNKQYICILCCLAILIIMLASLKGCYACSSREGMSSPSEIYQNQDRIKELKKEACVKKQYASIDNNINNLQKRVKSMKKAKDNMAAGDAQSDKVASE